MAQPQPGSPSGQNATARAVHEEQLLRDAATYSIAKEGHEGVIISVGAPVSVAVDPNRPRAAE